jgi:GGDEF domain-containing protein
VGVAIYPDHADSAFDLVGAADRAMYRAKQAGGSTVELAASWS